MDGWSGSAGLRGGRRIWLFVVGLGLTACALTSVTPTTRLQDAVYDLNDAARWGRLDLAAHQVAPAYRSQFRLTRLRWSKAIQVADMELVGLHVEHEQAHASALMSFSWYTLDAMTLHYTVIEQRWDRSESGFVLASERVVDGDAALLALPSDSGAAAGNGGG